VSIQEKKIIKIGHRGFRKGVDENTFDAFETAVNNKMDFIECDVQKTKDNILVIMHDETIGRTMKGKARVKEATIQELKAFRSIQHDFEIPTAEETIEKYKDRIHLMMEIKDSNVAKDLALLVLKHNAQSKVVFSGKSFKDFQMVQSVIPDAEFCLNITAIQDFTVKDFLKVKKKDDLPIQLDMISLSAHEISKKFVDKCHKFDIKALCWNFLYEPDPVKKTQEMIDLGIDGILFDHPDISTKF
jgi:glycerophosphoryl diester phosphodiesterase